MSSHPKPNRTAKSSICQPVFKAQKRGFRGPRECAQMSLKAYEWAARVDCPDGVCKAVLLQFASFHNQQTGQCNPSNATMIDRCQFDPKTFRAAVRRLENAGLLAHTGSTSGGRKRTIMRVLLAPTSAGVMRFGDARKPSKSETTSEKKGTSTQSPFQALEKGANSRPPIREGSSKGQKIGLSQLSSSDEASGRNDHV